MPGPRTTRSTSTGLSMASSRGMGGLNVGIGVNARNKMVGVEQQQLRLAKRKAEEAAGTMKVNATKRRPALGEITNVRGPIPDSHLFMS